MIRPRIRLGTLALLILIAALICDLVVQRQQEQRLRVEFQAEVMRARAEAAVARVMAERVRADLARARSVQPPLKP